MAENRLPPHNREAERSVIGSMVRDNSTIDDVLAIVQSADAFYLDAHRRIFRKIVELYRAGKPVDLVILAEALQASGEFEDVGKGQYLAELWDAAPTAANVEFYARIVRDLALRRGLLAACGEILRAAGSGNAPAAEVLAEAEQRILAVADVTALAGGAITLSESLAQAMADFDRRIVEGRASGLPTGFTDLDDITAGLQAGELTIAASRPSIGKTALTISILRHVCGREQLPALFFSLEQAHSEVAIRLLCGQSGLNSRVFRAATISQDDTARIQDAQDQLATLPLLIDDRRLKIGQIVAEARRAWRRHGIKVVALDYLQLIPADDETQDRRHQIGRQSKALKALARELKIPVLCLAQLNRLSANNAVNTKPRLSHIAECGEVEQDADVVWLLHRPDADSPVIETEVAKNRNGATGECKLHFRRGCMRFENAAYG
jgi:replicative DNA helicase